MKKNSLEVKRINANSLLIRGSEIAQLINNSYAFKADMTGSTITVTCKINKTMAARAIITDGNYENDWPLYTRTGYVTTCILEKNGCTCVGHSICAPGDSFDADVGKAIAYLRAVGKPVPSYLTA